MNSAVILGFAESSAHYIFKKIDWGFRPGILLYGYPSPGAFRKQEFKPVMSFKSTVVQQHTIEAGQSVSYGAKWTASKKSYIGTVAVGYADGFSRVLSSQGYVLVGGIKLPVLGAVCMDFVMVDLSKLVFESKKENWVSEEVTLFGYDQQNNLLSADEWAQKTNSISYEVLTSVSSRVPRHFKGLKKS